VNEETERRLRKLIDPMAYANDVWYHAQVATFRSWLTQAELAMRDEKVSNTTIQAVLNRMVFGVPYPNDPEGRTVTMPREDVENLIMNQDPRRRPKIPWPDYPPPAPNRPGHRDVADLYIDKGPHGPHPT
jgi:hypothetical protein